MNYQAAKTFILDQLEQHLAPELTYHGVHHTLDVLRVAEELCRFEGIDSRQVILIKTAALFHDAGFMRSNKQHEWHSCRIVEEFLPRFGYSPAAIRQINRMILATRIPQSPTTIPEKILCDADLDYLGRDDFFPIGSTLFQELKTFGQLTDEQEWNRLQVSFLEQHRFFTPTNIRRRRPQKLAHLAQLRQMVEAGT